MTTDIAPPRTTSEAMSRPLPFEPEDFSQVWALANWLQNSQLIPSALRGKPADLLIVIATGRELGLSPMQSLRSLHVVEGKPGMSAELIAARIRSSKVCRYLRLVESTADVATYETQRIEDDTPTVISFTIEEARSMGLAGKDNYKKQPGTMLRARCISKLGRAVYQDVMSGVYELDELSDISAPTVTVLEQKPPEPKSVAALASLAKKKYAPKAEAAPSSVAPGAVLTAAVPAAPTVPTVEPETASALEDEAQEPELADAPPAATDATDAQAAPQPSARELVVQIEGMATRLAHGRMAAICNRLGGDVGALQFGLGTDGLKGLLEAVKAELVAPAPAPRPAKKTS